jgi:tRNA threonylcarbamoyladenosine biosynthesis protein TsaB
MLIFGVDTSGRNGSLALCRAATSFQTLEVVSLAGGTYSAQLIPQLSAMLSRQRLEKAALDAFAVVSGPGSFTGLRVGLAAVKALAEVMDKPIAAVSALEAVAWRAAAEGRLIAALDAGRSQVFLGEYVAEEATRRCLREWLLTLDELVASAPSEAAPIVTSDESLANALRARGRDVALVEPPQADVVARIGWHKLTRGESVSPEALEANYIRRSDAEIFSRSST